MQEETLRCPHACTLVHASHLRLCHACRCRGEAGLAQAQASPGRYKPRTGGAAVALKLHAGRDSTGHTPAASPPTAAEPAVSAGFESFRYMGEVGTSPQKPRPSWGSTTASVELKSLQKGNVPAHATRVACWHAGEAASHPVRMVRRSAFKSHSVRLVPDRRSLAGGQGSGRCQAPPLPPNSSHLPVKSFPCTHSAARLLGGWSVVGGSVPVRLLLERSRASRWASLKRGAHGTVPARPVPFSHLRRGRVVGTDPRFRQPSGGLQGCASCCARGGQTGCTPTQAD